LPEAIDAATRLALQLEQRGQTDDLLYQTLATMLDVMLSAEGRRNEARAWNGKLIAELERSGGDTTMGMSSARHNQAGHLYDAGEVRAALEVQRDLVDKIVAQQGVDTVAATSAHRLGLYQILVEESDDGMKWIDLGLQTALAQNDHRGQIGALLSRAWAHLERGRPGRALTDVQAAERLCRENPQENRVPLRSARLLRGGVLVAQHFPDAAIAEINAVLDEIGYPRQRVANQLAPMLTLKARAELEQGNAATALATARDALAVAEANAPQPDRSATVGDALIAIARAEQQLGNIDAARAAAQRAGAILSKAMGPGHSKVREANSLL
jgi:tetratricopeptide (TPR) repeat protein